MPTPSPQHGFGQSRRLRHTREFQAVYDANVRKVIGPIALLMLPNDSPVSRLGLSVSAKVGTAVRRNRIKRLLRAAFRLAGDDLPAGYDMVVVVRPHQPMTLGGYQSLLREAAAALHRRWGKRGGRHEGTEARRHGGKDTRQ